LVIEESAVIHTIISISLLLFTAKIMSELFHRVKLPIVVGQLLAGVLIGPYAIGGLFYLNGQSIVVINETIKELGELSAIVILFIAGLEITPREFFQKGISSFTVGASGVLVPFVMGYFVFSFLGLSQLEAILVATALTATSIAISVRVLQEIGKMKSKEGRLILGAAIVDDVLAIALLSVITSIVRTGIHQISIFDIVFLFLETLGIFGIMLISISIIIPKLLKKEKLLKSENSIEGIITASFFGAAGIAAIVGLSPIVGAFAMGMAVASTHLITRIEEYVRKLEIIFVPLFFAIIGAQVNLLTINPYILYLAGIMLIIAIISKIIGTGLPAIIFLKNKSKGLIVGTGMISRGEVGLIVAQLGILSGALSSNVYTMIVIMATITTIISPILLKILYRKLDI